MNARFSGLHAYLLQLQINHFFPFSFSAKLLWQKTMRYLSLH